MKLFKPRVSPFEPGQEQDARRLDDSRVVIGIAAVTTMVSIGQSASDLLQGQFQNLGTT